MFFIFSASISADAQTEAAPLRLGGTLPGEIAWSPDSSQLLVAASDMTRLYVSRQWDAPVAEFPAARRASFVDDRTIELDGQRYDVETAEMTISDETIEVPVDATNQPVVSNTPARSPSGKYEYKSDWRDQLYGLLITTTQEPEVKQVSLPINDDTNVSQLIFSPDEAYLALIYSDSSDLRNRLQLWHIETGKRIFEARSRRSSIFDHIRFNSAGDTLLATETAVYEYGPYDTYSSEYVTTWHVSTGEILQTENLHYFDLIAEDPTGQWLAFGTNGSFGENADLLIWNGLQLIRTEFGFAYSSRFSKDGSKLITVGENSVGVFKISPETQNFELLGSIPSSVGEETSIALNKTGDLLLLTAGYSRPMQLWDTNRMVELARFDGSYSLYDVQFSPDDSLFSIDRKTFWDTRSGEKRYEFAAPVKISPDWSSVAYWDISALVVVALADGRETRESLIENEYGVYAGIDPLNRWAFFQHGDALNAYDVDQEALAFTIPAAPLNAPLTFTADGSHLVVPAGNDALDAENPGRLSPRVSLWEISGTDEPTLKSVIHTYWKGYISADAAIFADVSISYYDTFSTVGWSDMQSGEYLGQLPETRYGGSLHSVRFHPFKLWMAVKYRTGETQQIYVVDVEQTIARGALVSVLTQPGYFAEGKSPDFSPSGNYLVISCGENCIQLTDLRDLPETGILVEAAGVVFSSTSAIAYDALENIMLTKNSDSATAFLHIPDIEMQFTLPATGNAIALNADASLAATTTADGIAVWDIGTLAAEGNVPLATFALDGLMPTALRFDAANRLIAQDIAGITIYDLP